MRADSVIALACAAAAAAAGCKDTAAERAASLEVLGEIPDFALTDHTGAALTRADLAGDVVVANFIFTRCPTVCPVFTMKMQRLTERLVDARGLRFVSFSVDPEHDTPAVLAAYAAEHGADPSRWRFVTGDPEALRATVEDGLKMAMERRGQLPGGAPDIVHATHFVLLDRQGRIRGYYDSSVRERIDALIADARALAGSR